MGATQVQGTINGIGERCGNVDLLSVVANLALKRHYDVLTSGSLARLTEVSRSVDEMANLPSRTNQPFVGGSAFAHKGGMHAHAVARNAATYEHIDPAVVGNERRILISELAGQSTILAKTSHYALAHDRALLRQILSQVQDLENAGYEFEAAEASFDLLVKKATGQYRPYFHSLGYRVNIEKGVDSVVRTKATVTVRVDAQMRQTLSNGDGPVDALTSALRKALLPFYPRLATVQLADYKVRVVNGLVGTAARVRVVIEWRDTVGSWGTVGVSENILEANWLALVDSFEYKLFKDGEPIRWEEQIA
jgi:2-isopropylmalate synthase